MTDIDKRRKQMAKNKKIAEVQSAGVQAQISLLLEGVANSSVEILSCTKRATVVLLRINKNTGVFKLGTDSSRWLPKIQKVIEVFADFTKSGEDIFCVINEQKLPLAEIPEKKAEKMTLKTDSAGRLNLFALGVLRKMEYDGLKNLSLFGITKICELAFCGCTLLTSVSIPPSVTEIHGNPFAGCVIRELYHPCFTIKDGIAVRDNKFLYCERLRSSITIPDGVTEIGDWALAGCESFLSVVIPEGVTKIGRYAFMFCTSLSSVVISSGVTKIGMMAFANCDSLSSVVLPSSLKELDNCAFAWCDSLSSVEFGGTEAQWKAVEFVVKDVFCGVPAKSVKCADGEAEL